MAKNAHVGQNKKFWSRPFSIRFTGGGVRKKTGRRAHQEERNERGVFYHSFCCFFGFSFKKGKGKGKEKEKERKRKGERKWKKQGKRKGKGEGKERERVYF